MNYLNLGCGSRFHTDWVNIDFSSTDKSVIAHNLIQGIPRPDRSFDVVYHSHVLEHFTKPQAQSFLQECYRVLKPGGTLRIAIPDLEQIAKTYLLALAQAQAGSTEWAENYNWIILEMLDQSVRHHAGGEMASYLTQPELPNQSFVIDRIGSEGKNLIEIGNTHRTASIPTLSPIDRWVKPIYRFIRYPHDRREILLKRFLGQSDYQALKIGQFRLSGEVHQWMYDRYSLAKLLELTGFQHIIQQTATASSIPNWTSFNLDTEPDGSIYKPDSLYMEAIKPDS
jgi:predicted SAM-dependent methyltransferase